MPGSRPMAFPAADPLPFWRAGPVKEAIQAFVARVCTEGSPEWGPETERIAVVDNDGTLWPEQPVPFQAAFAFDELRRCIVSQPALAADPLVPAAAAGDLAAPLAGAHIVDMRRDWRVVFAAE